MKIGDRIKARREELNMTQEDLANKLGYKSRSSINKIEKDGRELPQIKIKAIADALYTAGDVSHMKSVYKWCASTVKRQSKCNG